MLRSFGSVAVLVLFMIGCGGGGGNSSSPPPPPVAGTVSGLVGSGLTLSFCVEQVPFVYHHPCAQYSDLVISANGAFSPPAAITGNYSVYIIQQPTSPAQRCVMSYESTGVMVSCTEYSYVTNAADNTLSSYSVDPTTGALSVVGPPIAAGASPHAIVGFQNPASADQRFFYVGNEGGNDVSAFAVNPVTGALTAIPGSPFPAGTDPEAMAFDGSYLFGPTPYLFVANTGSDSVSVYTVDVSTGALTPGSPATIATGKGPTSIVIDGSLVYVANHGGSNDISVFDSSLTPVPGSPFPAGGNPLGLALRFGIEATFLYSANPDTTNPSISGFRIDPDTGALLPLSGSPFPIPVSHYIAIDQTGAYLYVTSGANILGYGIDATTGALTALPGFPVSAGANAYSITIDPTNQFLYVANEDAANVSGFTLDASTGGLTPMASSPFPAGNRPGFLATF